MFVENPADQESVDGVCQLVEKHLASGHGD
jgi:hypothetical protein